MANFTLVKEPEVLEMNEDGSCVLLVHAEFTLDSGKSAQNMSGVKIALGANDSLKAALIAIANAEEAANIPKEEVVVALPSFDVMVGVAYDKTGKLVG